jgi:hypothetical protein
VVLASWQPRSGVSLILLKHVGLLHEQACSLLACSVSTHVGREGTSRRAPGLRGSEDVAKSRCMTQVQGGLLRVVGRGRAPPKMFPAVFIQSSPLHPSPWPLYARACMTRISTYATEVQNTRLTHRIRHEFRVRLQAFRTVRRF